MPIETTDPPVAQEAPPMPRWVKVLGIIAILLVAAFIGLHLAGLSPTGH